MSNVNKLDKGKRMVWIVIKLLQNLSQDGLTYEQIAEDHSVSKRTLLRDIDSIKKVCKELNVNFTSPGPGSKKNKKYRLETPIFSSWRDERILFDYLHLENEILSPVGEITECYQDMESLKNQINQYHYLSNYIDKMTERIFLIEPSFKINTDFTNKLKKCITAIKEDKIINIYYKSKNATKGKYRKICPYGLIYQDRHWYLPAYCYIKENIRMFRVDRIKEVNITSEKYSYPEQFSLKKIIEKVWSGYIQESGDLIEVKIRAEGEAAEELNQFIFHHTQYIEKQKDGSVIVSFKLETWRGMVSWILKWGDLLEVIEPTELREHLLNIATKVADKYK